MAKTDERKSIRCSFCGKPQSLVERLIAGNGAYICDECVKLCMSIVDEDYVPKENNAGKSQPMPELVQERLPKPAEIKANLDEYVIGQEEAKKVLSVAVYNHYKRILHAGKSDVELQKSNILLIGPTGSGKTLFAQTLARMLNVPFAIADATTLTEAGYVGEDVENILLKLLQAADFDVERAEHGIIYVDEIDKIAASGNTSGADVSREGVQRDILPIVEGSTVTTKYGPVKTDFILFIAAGAFHVSKVSDLIPELQGRFPIRVKLEALTVDDYKRILTQPQHAITKQYEALLKTDNILLSFTDDALGAIAKYAFTANEREENIGARRLHTIVENLLDDISFNAGGDHPLTKVEVDEKYVKEHVSREYEGEDLQRFIL